jgi:hypothetical protein
MELKQGERNRNIGINYYQQKWIIKGVCHVCHKWTELGMKQLEQKWE